MNIIINTSYHLSSMSTNSHYNLSSDDELIETKKQLQSTKRWTLFFALCLVLITAFTIFREIKHNNDNTCTTPKIPSAAIIIPTAETAVNHTITPDSAAIYNGTSNYKNSPYYKVNNFYDGTPSPTLQILPKFQTYQQTTAYSCGAAAGYMALNYLGVKNVTENDIAQAADTKPHAGTTTNNLARALAELTDDTFEVTHTENDGNLSWRQYVEMVKTNIANGAVMIVADLDWNGHWRCIIGYDQMGTETTADDVVILADPYDTTDHSQDGYVVQSSERFYSTWEVHGMFSEGHSLQQFVTVQKKKQH